MLPDIMNNEVYYVTEVKYFDLSYFIITFLTVGRTIYIICTLVDISETASYLSLVESYSDR